MSWTKKGPSHTVEMTLTKDSIREIDDGAVDAVDQALLRVGSGEVMHLMDPRRIQTFEAGGPATWSVAYVPVGDDHLFVTYGNSDRLEPARQGIGFELSIRVPARTSGIWPGMLLRQLVRYMRMSRRELRVHDFMPFPTPITRVVAASDDFPMTKMDAIVLVPDPLLPSIEAPRGTIEVRRVVGIHPDEREAMEPWSVQGLARTMHAAMPNLETDIARPSLASNVEFTRAMNEGARREGSQFAFVAVNGVSWEQTREGVRVTIPGGNEALRIHRMVRARLPFGKHLLVHDTNPDQRLAVALRPSDHMGIGIDGEVLVIDVPGDAEMLAPLANPPPEPIVWTFRA